MAILSASMSSPSLFSPLLLLHADFLRIYTFTTQCLQAHYCTYVQEASYSIEIYCAFDIPGGSEKMSHLTKCNFSTTKRFLTKISGFVVDGVFNNDWKLHWNVCIASRITAFTIFYSVLQNDAEEMDSHLLCSTVKLFFSKHVLNVHPIFHTSLMSFCKAHYGLIMAAGFILTVRLSSVHQYSLACDEIF